MRNPLHALCPYFAMFPEAFVAKNVLAYTRRGDVVFDPFCGRGTAIFESLLNSRFAAGVDVNPVAACVAGAKADPPVLRRVLKRLDELEARHLDHEVEPAPAEEFFKHCFHPKTLQEVLFLRRVLDWRATRVDRFLAAVTLGCLHGESQKSPNYLSNRMPRTISTKPDYSVRWWKGRGMTAPLRATFEVLRNLCAYRLSHPPAPLRGKVCMGDARSAAAKFPELRGMVKLMVTSPPYLDTTNFMEDQWLRLWFLGGPERPHAAKTSDDRHTETSNYWQFLTDAWHGCAGLLHQATVIVVRIGGTRLTKAELFDGLRLSLSNGLVEFKVRAIHRGLTTEIRNRQTNSFRPGVKSRRFEHDFAFRLS